jgi:hypothetical protein
MRSLDAPKPRKPAPGASGGRPAAPDSLAGRLEELEKALERVRLHYETYFLGTERRSPEQDRLDLQRRINEARRTPTSNTALKFRLDTLVQKVTVLSAYWNRTMREIEAGTYRRDVAKAARHLAERAARAKAPALADETTQVDAEPPWKQER